MASTTVVYTPTPLAAAVGNCKPIKNGLVLLLISKKNELHFPTLKLISVGNLHGSAALKFLTSTYTAASLNRHTTDVGCVSVVMPFTYRAGCTSF